MVVAAACAAQDVSALDSALFSPTYGIFHDFPFRSAVESYIETEVTTTTLTFTTSTGTSNWAGEVTISEKLV